MLLREVVFQKSATDTILNGDILKSCPLITMSGAKQVSFMYLSNMFLEVTTKATDFFFYIK